MCASIFTVEAQQNHAPSFDKSLFVVSVPEEREKGYVVTTMSASDIDGTDIHYTMSAVLDARSQTMFSIDPVSGVVTTTVRLDREFMDVHYLRVTAVDSGMPPRTGTTTLQINVNDENDHQPTFEQASYHGAVRESAPVGSTVVTVRATDQDSGSNADLEYSILNPTGINDVFRIDSHTGMITTRGSLDLETIKSYSLTVQATDLGPLPTRKQAQTTVDISILDDNDNYPQFTNRSYTASVREDINFLNHPTIAAVSATDADEGMNAAIRYSIIGGNTQSHFHIDSLSGEVSVAAPLDYESTRSYRLIIRAQDAGSPPRSNTTQLLINVEDVNDNEPKFYSTLFQESVMENTPAGQSILRIQAYDGDDGQNAAISYRIKDAPALTHIPLTIETQTGWIVTTKELDWEEGNLYEFVVVAQDHGDPPKSSTSSVIIRVQDLNDNAPVFEPKIYDASVSEIDPPGTPVITVTATDRDENSRLIFQITSGNVRGRFNIISQNNQGLISVAQQLDYKAEKRFVLSVIASDPGGKTDIATVYINVTDANTHRPIIERTPYSTNIPEDTPIGTTVLVIEASDADVGENARITYSMDDVPEFRIDPISGAITCAKKLDRETSAGYTIVVTAMDNGVPPLADTTNVEIEISDINDNAPEFRQESYTASIIEDSPIGTSVVQLQAIDSDLGLNGQVRYMFAAGRDGDSAFVVDPTSGIIRTNKALDRESVDKYELLAQAVDRGTPPLTSSVVVTIAIEDVNDNPPRFESERLRFYVPENSPVGYVVGEVRAIDPDVGENAKIEYSIVGGADANSFTLISRPGEKAELITRTDMDFESAKKKYNLIIRASYLPLRNDVDVEVLVMDVNDNAPLLSDFAIVFNNYKNHFPLNSIGKVPAFDADVADQLQYKIVSGNKAHLVDLNETSGEIRLSPNLNTNVPTRAVFEVSVFDGINEASAQCLLVVNLVTEAMLFNSVTIRLNRISQKTFLSSLFDRFLEGLAAIIPTSKESIVIFNIQDDSDDINNILNVSFSVRLSDDRDLDSFYSPQFFQERIYLSRSILTKATGLEVLPFDDNLCVREPCLNFEQCLSVLKFGNASEFVASDTILFRPIQPVNTFACRCPKGFSGMYHRYECDAEVNLCYSNPCLNKGTCQRKESDYACLCPDGFTGKNCEVNIATDHCRPNICRGNSRCINGAVGAIGELKTDANQHHQLSGFQCANCTYADWSTSLCELRARSFSRGSYLTFPALRQRYRFSLKLRFATRHDNVLLLYNGRYNDQHDFIALEIVEGKLLFSFSLGARLSQVSITPPDGYLTNGQWHWIEINYLNRTAELKLDDCDEAVQRSLSKNQLHTSSFVCFNATTHELEERCYDRMQSCYRFLDLTGPLQLGGLPPLPTQFQTSTNHFVGCISDFEIDHQLTDFNSYVANNGTQAGCLDKRGFCHSFPCKNGGTCREGWGKYICDCKDGFLGQDCSEGGETVKNFRGNGFLTFTPRLRPLRIPWLVKVAFKTYESNGLILKMQLGQSSKIFIEVINGRVRYMFNGQSVVIQDAKVNDGKWHMIEANWMINGIWLNLDYGQQEANRDFEGDIKGLYISKVSVGDLEQTESDELSEDITEYKAPNFIGGIQGLDVGNSKDAWMRPTLESNVAKSCDYPSLCLSDPCPPNSDCIDKGLGRFECDCHTGYIGKNCIPICEVNACAANAKCTPYNNTRGYKCECDQYHTGPYCDELISQVCPSNWWGYPICGPCSCDTSKGYDGNCNKTTGECMCEANHYQPLNSDICFDCECYAVGSFSNRCDLLTGQCSCRHGVIGRRCDSCASPFAEVTLNGCEVIYDGCPRAFEDQIWWERTPFGSRATTACPKGSTGKATRACDENEGWQKADSFDCLSTSFTDLSDQLLVIEKDKFPLTTYLAIKLANELRTAVNVTETLYGSDVFVAFKLVHHLLSYELKQSGLNLTHKQDRYFLPNIIGAINSIVDLRYVEHWNRIGEMLEEGGPEHIVRLLQQYGQVLIENREDTFTDPFEFSSENLIIGLDTISTHELWDMSYIESFSELNKSSLFQSAASSYVDYSLADDIGVGVALPKYNNYPIRKQYEDDVTRLILPLKTVGVMTAPEALAASKLASFSVQRRNQARPTAVYFYAIFPTLGQLLPDSFDHSIRYRLGMPLKANTPLFTFVMKPANSSQLLGKQLNPKIQFRLRTLMGEGRNNPRCAYWSFGTENNNGNNRRNSPHHRGKWSTKGCEVKGVYPAQRLFTSYEYVNCTCDRVAPVTVLMDVAPSFIVFEESGLQNIISYVGLLSSILILSTTFVILTIILGLRTNSNDIHRNIVFCLLLVQILFMIALKFRDVLVQREFPCKMVAIFLHYFYVCIFSWLLVEGVHLHRMLTEIRDINHGPMKFYYFLGYAMPAIIVSLAVGVRAESYGNYIFCWLSMYESVIWSMVGPICLIATLNVFVFAMALRASIQIKEAVSDYGNMRTLLWLSIVLLPALGCQWILAMLAANETLEELHYVFYFVSFISALYIFIGYCVINRRVRYNIKIAWWRLNGKKVPSFVDDSLSQTRISCASRSVLMQNASPFDAMHNRQAFLYGISTSSTTSRSTTTKASSGTYMADIKVRRGRKRSNRRKNRGSQSESDGSLSNPSLDLASSHSSASAEQIAEDDEDVDAEDDEDSSEPVINIRTNPLEESDSVPDLNIHANPLNVAELSMLAPVLGPQINQRVDSLPDGEHTIYTTWTVDPDSRNRSSF